MSIVTTSVMICDGCNQEVTDTSDPSYIHISNGGVQLDFHSPDHLKTYGEILVAQ